MIMMRQRYRLRLYRYKISNKRDSTIYKTKRVRAVRCHADHPLSRLKILRRQIPFVTLTLTNRETRLALCGGRVFVFNTKALLAYKYAHPAGARGSCAEGP